MKENLRRMPEKVIHAIAKKSVGPALAATLLLTSCYGHLEGKSPGQTIATATPSAASGTPTPQPTETPTLAPTPTLISKPIESTPTPEIAADFCPDADQIGIWAPNANGEGETFEIDSAKPDAIILANLWFPGRSAPDVEYQLILKERRIQIKDGAGTAWQYKKGCTLEDVQRQGREHQQRRQRNGSIIHNVTVEELNAQFSGLVRILPGDSTLK